MNLLALLLSLVFVPAATVFNFVFAVVRLHQGDRTLAWAHSGLTAVTAAMTVAGALVMLGL